MKKDREARSRRGLFLGQGSLMASGQKALLLCWLGGSRALCWKTWYDMPLRFHFPRAQRDVLDVLMPRAHCSHTAKRSHAAKDKIQKWRVHRCVCNAIDLLGRCFKSGLVNSEILMHLGLPLHDHDESSFGHSKLKVGISVDTMFDWTWSPNWPGSSDVRYGLVALRHTVSKDAEFVARAFFCNEVGNWLNQIARAKYVFLVETDSIGLGHGVFILVLPISFLYSLSLAPKHPVIQASEIWHQKEGRHLNPMHVCPTPRIKNSLRAKFVDLEIKVIGSRRLAHYDKIMKVMLNLNPPLWVQSPTSSCRKCVVLLLWS